ncbi:putative ATP-dependent DNA helicase II, 70 kDa subunit, partial [Toxoplasma gondii VAND]
MDFDASEAARFLFEGSESEGEDEFFDDLLRLDERSGAPSAQVASQSEDAGDFADESLPRGRLIAPREEIVLFCIDCLDVENLFRRTRPRPLETDSEREEGAAETKLVPWEEIITACTTFVRRKIVSGQRLLFGVFLVGTGASENALGFPHISAALPVDEVDVQTILRLQALSRLSEEDFRTQFGDSLSRASPECPPLADVFWVLSHALSAGTRRRGARALIQQRIILFTSNDSPCPTGAPEALAAATQRLRDLREDGVDVCLVPLEFPGTAPFSMETFWGDALCLTDDELREGEGSNKTTPTVSAYKSYVRLRMDELNDNVRLLDRTQRVLSTVPLHLRPSLQLPVCLLSSVRPQPLPRPHAVLTADEKQEPLRPGRAVQILPGTAKSRDAPGQAVWKTNSSRADVVRRGYKGDREQTEQTDEETEQEGERDGDQEGEGEESEESRLLRRLQLLGPEAVGYYTFAGGQKIGLEWGDIKAMKDFGPPGLTLLCCLPAASLDFELTTASPLFVTTAAAAERAAGRTDFSGFKDEQEKLFSAFLMTLCKRALVAVARLVSKRGSPVSLVALLPQLEEVDEAGNTVQAPGLHLLRLPFAEDIRQIDFPWSSAAGCRGDGGPADLQDKAARKEENERRIQAAMRALSG